MIEHVFDIRQGVRATYRDPMARRTRRSHTDPLTPDAAGRGRGASARRTTDAAALPDGPVAIPTGTVHLERDPDDPRGVTVHVNGVPSSYVHLDDPSVLAFEYMQQMACVIEQLPPGPVRAVHLGAAGCSMARQVAASRPGSRQIAVDPDPTLLELARGWFGLPRAPELRLRAADGRAALAGMRDASADVVIRDAFAPDRTPEHMTTSEFLAEVARVLRPGGVYLANVADRPPLALARSEVATALAARALDPGRAAWSDVALVAEPAVLKGRRYGNLVLVAVRAPDRDTQDDDAHDDAPGVVPTSPLDLAPRSGGLERRLRTLPVPASLLAGDDVVRFGAGAPVLLDAPARASTGPAPAR